ELGDLLLCELLGGNRFHDLLPAPADLAFHLSDGLIYLLLRILELREECVEVRRSCPAHSIEEPHAATLPCSGPFAKEPRAFGGPSSHFFSGCRCGSPCRATPRRPPSGPPPGSGEDGP